MSRDSRRKFPEAEAVAVARVQATMRQAMESAGVSRSELARRLGTAPEAVTQMFYPGANPTARRVAAVLHVCGFEPLFSATRRPA